MVKCLLKTEQLDLLRQLAKDNGIRLQDSIEGTMSVVMRAQNKKIEETQTENQSTRKETPITQEGIPKTQEKTKHSGEDTDHSRGDTKNSGKDSGNVRNSEGDMDNSDTGNTKVTSGH